MLQNLSKTIYIYYILHSLSYIRAVIWLQKRRDEILERVRSGSLRKEEQYEYHIGRLRQDRVCIPRREEEVMISSCFCSIVLIVV